MQPFPTDTDYDADTALMVQLLKARAVDENDRLLATQIEAAFWHAAAIRERSTAARANTADSDPANNGADDPAVS